MDNVEALKPHLFSVGEIPVIVTPPGWNVHEQSELLPAEFVQKLGRLGAILSVENNESFAHYDKLFSTEATQYFARRNESLVRAVFDYHKPDMPGHREHVISRRFKLSREFSEWKSNSGKGFSQKSFAEFLQDRLHHLSRSERADVTQAQLLNAVLQFRATQNAICNSATNLTNGDVKFEFTRDTQVQSATLPTQLLLAFPIYEFGQPWEIAARLSYDLREGKVVFSYQLINVDSLVEDAFAAEVETLRQLIGGKFFILEAA
jgi:uncharacterized protein YfdQ (DUF2303 family)